MTTITTGTRVTVRTGFGYHLTDPIAFYRSHGNIIGIVTALEGETIYFRLMHSKRLCYAPIQSLEPSELIIIQH